MSDKTRNIIMQTLYWIVRAICIAIMIYGIIGLCGGDFDKRPYSSYITVILQSLLLIAMTILPHLVNKIFKIEIPLGLEIWYLSFSTCAVLFGEIFGFYATVDWWDDVLHTISGSFISVCGFVFIFFLNEKMNKSLRLSPFFIVVFCFSLSLAAAVVWEITEYTCDGLVGFNMQRYKESLEPYTPYVGREALADTMGDLIECFIGALLFNIVAYIDLKLKKSILREKLDVDMIERKESEEK